ncbi:hypothetical protein J4479_01895 [Candidatus Woesearchaeota archaeon]|nr:hypothetical protein [Candidatus Woesearchaeota archaeon]
MASIVTVLLFFLYTWGLGSGATHFLKKSEDSLENFFMQIGIGLGVFAILSIILNALHAPLDWRIFLFLSLLMPTYKLYLRYKNKNFKIKILTLTKSNLRTTIVLFIFFITLLIYLKGAFVYPYLENEDPWGHSEGVKYVALEKKAFDPPVTVKGRFFDSTLSYIDPYPPAYDILLGTLHQTSSNITWTMKFFNALIISLGIIFFYFLLKRFLKNENKALLATFILAALPSYLSHFIWAHSLAVTLFFPAMYAFNNIFEDKNWWYIAALMVAGIWVSQNLEQPIKLSTMLLLYLIIISITQRKLFYRGFIALGGGIILSLSWWGIVVKKYNLSVFLSTLSSEVASLEVASIGGASSSTFFSKIIAGLKAITNAGGSSSRPYGFNDFFIAQPQNLINTPIGIGIIVTILALVGTIYILVKYKSHLVEYKNSSLIITLFWLIYTFWAVNGETFPISIARGAFRTWMLLAIPVSIVAAEGIFFLKSVISGYTKNKLIWRLILTILLLAIILTSAKQKYDLNTAIWPTSSAFSSPQEAFEFGAWFKTIPDNTRVFLYSPRPKIVIGFGKWGCNWCQDELDFRINILDRTAEELYEFLKNKNYEYLLISPSMDFRQFSKKFGKEIINQKLPEKYREIIQSGFFTPVYQKENLLVALKVN